jgi:FkbM family methyltransferase
MTELFETRHGRIACLKNDAVFIEVMKTGKVYEEDLIIGHIIPILNRLEGKKTILDIGAHIGSHSILYSKYIPNCEIYAFEPQTEIYKVLLSNTSSLLNVKIYNSCIGHTNTNCSMSKMLYDGPSPGPVSYNTDKISNYGGLGIGLNGEKTTMVTVDSLNLLDCTYMKVDVEGAEPLVFMGALETIRKYKPIIFFEHTDKVVSDEMKTALSITEDLQNPITILENEGYIISNVDQWNKIAMPTCTQY